MIANTFRRIALAYDLLPGHAVRPHHDDRAHDDRARPAAPQAGTGDAQQTEGHLWISAGTAAVAAYE